MGFSLGKIVSGAAKVGGAIAGSLAGQKGAPSWLGPLGAALGVGGDIYGSMVGTAEQNALNIAQSKEARDWAANQRATAYQTTIQDLKKAGLSPMLAYSQGASSNVAAPGVPNQESPIKVGINSGLRSQEVMNQTQLVKAQIGNTQASTELNLANAEKSRREASLATAQEAKTMQDVTESDSRIFLNDKQRERIGYEINEITSRYDLNLRESLRVTELTNNAVKEGRLIDANVENTKVRTAVERINQKLMELEIPKAGAYSDFYKSSVGRASPYINLGTGALSDIASSAFSVKSLFNKGKSGPGIVINSGH